jgi:hypothetical protein
MQVFRGSFLVALGLAAGLSACVPASVFEKMPGEVGLPAGTPEAPATPYKYPAVHDMPPARAEPVMTEEQQVKLQNELNAERERQEAGAMPVQQPAPPPKKKTPTTAKKDQATGAQDGAKANP